MDKLFLISGTDDYAVKNKTREIIKSLCGPEPEDNPGLEIVSGDSDSMKPENIMSQLFSSINTPAFLGTDKITWLKHFLHFDLLKLKGGEKQSIRKTFDEFVDFINEGIPNDLTLVIDGPDLDRRTSFFKACQKHGKTFYFEKPDIKSRDRSETLAGKIKELCAAKNLRISHDSINFLIQAAGSDSGRLFSEIEKLACYIFPESSISLEDCREICSRTPEAAAWAFADAIAGRDIKKAIESIAVLVEQIHQQKKKPSSNAELSILGSTVRRFREMIEIKADASKLSIRPGCSYPQVKSAVENPPPEIKEELKESMLIKAHPYRSYMLLKDSSNYSDKEFASILTLLLEANRMLVSGTGSPRIILENLVMKICRMKTASK